jgi:TFIIF-interacting CTD phosphatase-like protein
MVIVDNSPYSYVLSMDNAVPILPFFGNSKDSELKNLLNYLREVIKVKDVRDLNKSHFKLT